MIVNADDFGASAEVNLGVVRAFDDGLISSATLMANMPGFEEAVALAHERRLLPHVGVHLVLSAGVPLTGPAPGLRRFCDDDGGRFVHWSLDGRALRLRRDERGAVAAELRAQVRRCRDAGLPVTHLDSHHQVHTHPGIAPVVAGVARDLGVAAVRLAENCRPGLTVKHRTAVSLHNRRLRRLGLARTRWFGTADDYRAAAAAPAPPARLDSFEVMVHPVLGPSGALVDSVEGAPLTDVLAGVAAPGAAESYAGAVYRRARAGPRP